MDNEELPVIGKCIECGCDLTKDITSYQNDTCDECWEEINNDEDEFDA